LSYSADEIIRILELQPHPEEGGHFRETFRDTLRVKSESGDRAASTLIYFLLKRGERSLWHRVDVVEAWHYYAGAPMKLEVSEGKGRKVYHLGSNFKAGERPHAVISAKAWQQAESLGDWSLVGISVAPGFEFSTFEHAPENWQPA
jgi:predicted cupin superfamily sugar epimerase